MVLSENGKKFFCKKTTLQELEANLLMAKNISSQKIVIANKEYTLAVPEIYNWDKDVLMMDYFDGINLEFMSRNKEKYNFGIQILNELLKFFIYNNLYWIDFVPRNILINNNKINFVDFEKGIGQYSNIKEYLRNYVYEEYGSFSFLKDRIFTPDEIFDVSDEEVKLIHYVSDIGPKRIKAVAKILGIEEKLTHMEYLQIIKMFIIAEESKIINNNYTFPRIMLEKNLL